MKIPILFFTGTENNLKIHKGTQKTPSNQNSLESKEQCNDIIIVWLQIIPQVHSKMKGMCLRR